MPKSRRRIDVREVSEGVLVVSLKDAKLLDQAIVQELGDELFALVEIEEFFKIVLDFSKVEFVSSIANNKLIILDQKVKQHQGGLVFYGVHPEIREVFVITRLNQLFNFEESEQDAIRTVIALTEAQEA